MKCGCTPIAMSDDTSASLSGSDRNEGVLQSVISPTNNLDDHKSQMHTTFQPQSCLKISVKKKPNSAEMPKSVTPLSLDTSTKVHENKHRNNRQNATLQLIPSWQQPPYGPDEQRSCWDPLSWHQEQAQHSHSVCCIALSSTTHPLFSQLTLARPT